MDVHLQRYLIDHPDDFNRQDALALIDKAASDCRRNLRNLQTLRDSIADGDPNDFDFDGLTVPQWFHATAQSLALTQVRQWVARQTHADSPDTPPTRIAMTIYGDDGSMTAYSIRHVSPNFAYTDDRWQQLAAAFNGSGATTGITDTRQRRKKRKRGK